MPKPDASGRPGERGEQVALLRSQARALHAYRSVAAVPEDRRREYAIAVNVLSMTLLQGGLAMAMAAIERLRGGGALLLQHLAGAGVPGLEGANPEGFPGRVRGLDVDGYMLASRELREVASWLKRATQATFEVR